MERIGVLGGTFNPVHTGHINLAREFCARLGLSRVLLIPTQSPPHKQVEGLVPAGMRLAMCALAAAGEPLLEVSDIEIVRGGTSYTADTLMALSAAFPGAELYLLMGADMFLTLENWRNIKDIARLADLCAAGRGEEGVKDLELYAKKLESLYGARCHIENIPVLEVSSTMIRALVAQGEDASGLLPGGVFSYIIAHGLYAG